MLHSPIIDYPKLPIHIRLFKLTAVLNFKTPQLCIKGVKWRSQNINPTSDLPCSNQLQTAPGYFGSRTPLYTVWEREPPVFSAFFPPHLSSVISSSHTPLPLLPRIMSRKRWAPGNGIYMRMWLYSGINRFHWHPSSILLSWTVFGGIQSFKNYFIPSSNRLYICDVVVLYKSPLP